MRQAYDEKERPLGGRDDERSPVFWGWDLRVEQIGDATLYQGDCIDVWDYYRPAFDVVVTDPP